ncbi:hypothetical protein LINGRAPRIM_LOCUS1900, partial [Linum grandiflorum]
MLSFGNQTHRKRSIPLIHSLAICIPSASTSWVKTPSSCIPHHNFDPNVLWEERRINVAFPQTFDRWMPSQAMRTSVVMGWLSRLLCRTPNLEK